MAALLASIKNKNKAGSSGGVKSEVSALEAVEYFESGGKKIPRHSGLEGAETIAHYELRREQEKQ